MESQVEKLTGLSIELIEPKSTFDYRFNLNLKAKELLIYSKDKNTKFATIAGLNVSFKPIGFLFNKAYFKDFSTDKTEILIKRNSKNQIDILSSIKKEFFDLIKNNNIIITRFDSDIKNFQLVFDDSYLTKNKIIFDFEDIQTNISRRKKNFSVYKKGKIITVAGKSRQVANVLVDINSKYPINNINSEKLDINIDINNINLLIFNDLFKKYISKDIKTASGNLDIKVNSEKIDNKKQQKIVVNFKNPTFELENNKTISPYKNNVKFETIFDISKEKIDIPSILISSSDLYIKAMGKILKPFSKKPNVDIDIESKNTQINNIIPFIPDNAIFYRPKGIPTLKKSNFYGVLNGKINLKLFPLNMSGNLKVENVYIPKYPKSYRPNDVNLIFMKDKMRVYTRVYTPSNEYVLIDGVSNLDNSLYGKYVVKSTDNIDLKFAQLYLVPIQQIIGFNIGPVPIMNIHGKGKIDINTQGTIFDAQIYGGFFAKNASAKIDGLDAVLTNGNCELLFDDRNLIFKEIKGKMDGADFILTGTGNTKGNVKLNAKIKNGKSDKIFAIFKNSVLSKPYKKQLNEIDTLDGTIEADIDLIGTIDNYETKDLFEKFKPSGEIILKNNKINLNNGIKTHSVNGFLDFGPKQLGKFDFNLGSSKFNFEFNSKASLDKITSKEQVLIESQIFSKKIFSQDILSNILNSNILNDYQKNILNSFSDISFYSKANIKSNGYISLDDIDIKKLKHNGYLIGLNSSDTQNIKFNSGLIKIVNSNVHFNNFDVNYKNGNIKSKGDIYNAITNRPVGNLDILLDNISLEKLDKLLPKIKVENCIIKNGKILFKNNNIKFDALSMDFDSMPMFVNAQFRDIYNSQILETNFSTIINEKTSDNIINPYLIYPVKISGEVPLKGSFVGNINDYDVNFSAIIPKGSDISFSGANLGDINYKREIQGKIGVNDKVANVNTLKLIKFISNQNHKINPIVSLRANGKILQKNNSLFYDNFKVATTTPINVRMLNLAFKKSLLKKGNFDCNLNLNGDFKLPKINGRVNLYDLDIPLYDTEINNIKVAISDNFIDGEVLAKNQDSDVKINIHALNKLTSPYIVKDFIVLSDRLFINDILNSITPVDSKTDIVPRNDFNFKPDDFIVEKGRFEFKDVKYDTIEAKNLKGNLDYKNGLFNLSNVAIDIAEGKILAKGKYNLKTTKLDMNADMQDCDSNLLSNEFLNLQNQIFGKMNGALSLTTKHINTPQGIKNVKSNIEFSINNGKMPKLGSMEYLLRTGNLVKGGLLGLSLNNIIEVLTPYKTGEFEKISGNLLVKNGEIDSLNILTQGKNLSLFLEGNYSILENFADIKIYGKLSQKISNALGAVGNASINQIIDSIRQNRKDKDKQDIELMQKLSKIPPIETESVEPRYFKVKVLGDINKENYIKSFNWI